MSQERVMSQRRKLGVSGILADALLSIERNPKVVVSVMLLLVIPLKFLPNVPTFNPRLVLDFTPIVSRLPLYVLKLDQPKIGVSLRPIKLILNQLLTAAVVYLSVMVYPTRHSGPNEMLSKVRRTWKGYAITSFCAQIIISAYSFVFFVLGVFIKMMEGAALSGSLGFLLLFVMLVIIFVLGAVVFIFTNVAYGFSLVVSVVEEGCCGMRAIRRAGSLMKRRKFHGFVLSVLVYTLHRASDLAVRGMFPAKDIGWSLGAVASTTVGVLLSFVLGSLVTLFHHLVCNVYYHECKRSPERKGNEVGQGKLHDMIPFASGVHEAYP